MTANSSSHTYSGQVTKLVGGLFFVEGLSSVKIGDILQIENGTWGRVISVKEGEVKAMFLHLNTEVQAGLKVLNTGQSLQVKVGKYLLGQTISPLGLGAHHTDSDQTEMRPVEIHPLGLTTRTESTEQLDTGVGVVDLITPLAKGQRELIIGDKKTGKSQFALQVMMTQAANGTICIYAGMGKKPSALHSIKNHLSQKGLLNQCIFVVSPLGDAPGGIYLTPYSALTIAEYFRDQGRDTLVILDNMSLHAEYYREIALLAQSFPGKEAYPGDIFYQHSKLMERGGSFMIKGKRASITLLPIGETVESNLSGYIQTNLMSMTDGHLFFDHDIYLSGKKPAINLLLSVTRVGRQTQSQLEHQLTNKLIELISDYDQAQGYLRFGAELSESLQDTLNKGDKFYQFFHQNNSDILDRNLSIILAGIILTTDWELEEAEYLIQKYTANQTLRAQCQELIAKSSDLDQFLAKLAKTSQAWQKKL